MAASLKRLEDEMADDENTPEENGPEPESPEDPHSSAASASTTKSDDEEKKTPVPKKKSTSKKSKKNGKLNIRNQTEIYLEKIQENDDKSKSEFNECSVCLGPVVFPVRTPCGHVFCFLCLKGAARHSNRCPMCRQQLPIDFDKNPIILERQEVETLEDGHQWFYEGKNGWWQYDSRTSNEIEHHYKLNVLKFDVLICGVMYTIDLHRSVQYNRDNPNRKRKVKRENADNIDVKGVAGVH